MMQVALYKGKGQRLFDRLICWWTRSTYSHCEAVFDYNAETGQYFCASASVLDGGVRFRWMPLDPTKWDLVELTADKHAAFEWYANHVGRKYDYQGIVGCVIRAIPANPARWFCSSALAAALGWPEPWRCLPANIKNAADWEKAHG
jgi:hypothetical protein